VISVSFPDEVGAAVCLPSSSEATVRSSTSSWIWNARPESIPYLVEGVDDLVVRAEQDGGRRG